MITKETWEEDTLKEKVTIHNDRPDQHVLINKKLSVECKQKLEETLRRNADVFAWTTTVNTVVPRFVMEHQLQAYPFVEPVVHKKGPLTPDRRKAFREKVFEWLKEGIIRRMDYTSLNKVCAKDMYPFLKIEEELESLMGYQYKCFLRLPKEHSQVRTKNFRSHTPKDDGQGAWRTEREKYGVIMEYFVKISLKARVLELKRRNLKNTVLTFYTPYLTRKIRRICAGTSQETMKN
ncbi:hypothetical protein Tco_1304859 [Tanacetum coccineum]